jgi:hypothetical protein
MVRYRYEQGAVITDNETKKRGFRGFFRRESGRIPAQLRVLSWGWRGGDGLIPAQEKFL